MSRALLALVLVSAACCTRGQPAPERIEPLAELPGDAGPELGFNKAEAAEKHIPLPKFHQDPR